MTTEEKLREAFHFIKQAREIYMEQIRENEEIMDNTVFQDIDDLYNRSKKLLIKAESGIF